MGTTTRPEQARGGSRRVRRAPPGTWGKHLRVLPDSNGELREYHATKGWRELVKGN